MAKDFDLKNKIIKTNWGKSFEIPQFIVSKIEEKWFYLYEWIDENEVKTSVEISFLKSLIFLWPIALIIMTLLWFALDILSSIIFLIFFCIILVIYLSVLSIKKSILASKINFLVITDKYYSVNRKIWKIENWEIFIDSETLQYSKKFEEEPFSESKLTKRKESIKGKYYFWLKKWLKWWEEFLDSDLLRSKDFAQIAGIIIIILLAFSIAMSIIYFFGIALVTLFWIFLAFLNKKYLIWKWHLVLLINQHFEKIENFSKILEEEKIFLSKNLIEAKQNHWQDWLLLKINEWIEKINKNAKNAMIENEKLLKTLKNSEYNEIFNYEIYNSWLKKQIKEPIKWIINLLSENIFYIEDEVKKIEKNQENTEKNFSANLEVAKKRLFLKKDSIQKQIDVLKIYLEKLKV